MKRQYNHQLKNTHLSFKYTIIIALNKVVFERGKKKENQNLTYDIIIYVTIRGQENQKQDAKTPHIK